MKLTQTEIFNIFIEEFNKRNPKELNAYDEVLKERLGTSPKTIGRYFQEFQVKYNSIVEIDGRRRKTYKLVTPMDIITESFEQFEDIGWIFQMAYDGDPSVFKELEKFTAKSKRIYQFKNTPLEDINDIESKQSFKRLKNIIESRDYAKFTFIYDDKIYDNLKCLKLVFMDNNWYIAYVDNENRLRFGRVSFIQRVDFGSKSGHFQPSSVTKHLHFLEHNVQNSMTIYGVDHKKALLKASPTIARYFQKDMKKFLTSQKFVKELEDGSVTFEVSYTQELEILPFIQKWLPDLVVVKPKELREAYAKKLHKSFQNHTNIK